MLKIDWTRRVTKDAKLPRVALPVLPPAGRASPAPGELPAFPRSWYRVAHSREVARGEIKTVRYFDRELIVYRDEEGAAHVTDPFCPHLGAHLGVGGRVRGTTIVCPFHGWAYDGDGQCVDIPYCDQIPAKAKLATWRSREVNGMILVWFDPAGGEPEFEIPSLDDAMRARWKHHVTLDWTFVAHLQDIAENGVDFAHFKTLHQFLDVPEPVPVRADGARFALEFETRRRMLGAIGVSRMRADFYGMGFVVTPVTSGSVGIQTFMTATPVDRERVQVRIDVFFERTLHLLKAPFIKKTVTRVIRDEFERDIRVWGRKLYRPTPVLCASDGPIMKLREWCRQFYLPVEATHR